ncbi:hypothetical protein C1646_757867 [Rhizophagus diaphanus]|nr:hypothetical protein C1646_757867 [Rhizophagus diaphanus] [Rhizophagus sp. MUCL 43196]
MGKTGRINTTKVIDLEVMSSEVSTTIIQNESRYNDNSETENDDGELELEVNYKLVIKQADGTIFPAKNYSVTVSELNEFLLAIQNNIVILLKDEEINANDYNVSFKLEKAQEAGTLLVDMCDFRNFQSKYIKLAATKKIILILITMKKKEKTVKQKKKLNGFVTVKEPPTYPSFAYTLTSQFFQQSPSQLLPQQPSLQPFHQQPSSSQ